MEDYSAPWWLPGRHLQTMLAPLFALGQRVNYERERWTTPDEDFIDVDWAGEVNAPRMLALFHGLEGDSQSHYARAIVALALRSGGWRCAVPHFRGCSGEPNLKPRAYHAGDSEEIDWILRRFAERHPAVHAVGVSLGGNAVLKWLGEYADDAATLVRRAAVVSAPFDLTAFGTAVGEGFNRVYGWYFLYVAGLLRKALQKTKRFPGEFSALGIAYSHVRAVTTLPEFDDALTAPLHGFRNKFDYWKRASAVDLLPNIRVPTLLLNARNDPFLPERVFPKTGDLRGNVELQFPQDGGHAGFPGQNQWLARRVVAFLCSS
jgi:predicted alpha/beta-fold hydrolase